MPEEMQQIFNMLIQARNNLFLKSLKEELNIKEQVFNEFLDEMIEKYHKISDLVYLLDGGNVIMQVEYD